MDVERFAAELPGLFEDYPRSAAPKGRRFDDVVDGVPNLATENVLALLNLAASLLGTGESYVEVGSFYGASLIGAMRGNEGDFVAIDRFSFDVPEVRGRQLPHASREGLEQSLTRFDAEHATILEGDAFELIEGDFVAIDRFSFDVPEVRGRQLPRASREGLEQSLARFGAEHATILQGDAFELIESGALDDRRVGVYYWDGPHDYDSQLRGMRAVEPWLAPEALILVDDYDWEEVAQATSDYVAAEPKAELLVEIAGEAGGQVWWWDGVAAVAWRAPS